MPALTAGAPVIFRENAEHPQVAAIVTRVWANGKYVTMRTDDERGRIFTRLIGEVIALAGITSTPGDEAHCVSCGHLPGCSCPEDCSYEEDGR